MCDAFSKNAYLPTNEFVNIKKGLNEQDAYLPTCV